MVMISEKEIEHIAQLARLEISEKEKNKFQKELTLILEFVAKLKELDISKVEPTTGGISAVNVMRPDQESSLYSPETTAEILKQAPEKKNSFVKVQKIL